MVFPMSHATYTLRRGVSTNLIFESPHQNSHVPTSLHHHKQLIEIADQRVDTNVDYAANRLWETIGGDFLSAEISRLVVDLNRGADRVDSRICPNWPGAERYKDGGVIPPWARLDQRRIRLYDSPLDSEEVEYRLTDFWYPYHECLQHVIDEKLEQYDHVLLVSLHSTIPKDQHKQTDYPTVYLGTRNGRTCDMSIMRTLQASLEHDDVFVITSDYYQGAFTTQAYGADPRINTIQVELDRRYLPSTGEAASNRMLEALINALRGVITIPINRNSHSAKIKIPKRTYIDPLTGDILPYS